MDHRFDSLKYCLSGGSLVYGKRAYMKDWIDMENKNEWETIDTLTKDSNKTLMHVYVRETKDGYEYRLQRRKRAKEMPEICRGDLVIIGSHLGSEEVVVAKIKDDEIFWWNGRVMYSFQICHVEEIWRDNKQIWRRE